MYARIIVFWCLIKVSFENRHDEVCVTGRMTDVQSWVDEKGVLIVNNDLNNVIDLSANPDPLSILRQKVIVQRTNVFVRYLSLARCRLTKVPTFQIPDSQGFFLSETVEYLTLFGNNFFDTSLPGEKYDIFMNASNAREEPIQSVDRTQATEAVWSIGLQETRFPRLRELDLRACSIKVLSALIFRGMPNLQSLYLGQNEILFINIAAFIGLHNLIHLDLSKNEPKDEFGDTTIMDEEALISLKPLGNLTSLDFSHTKLHSRHVNVFSHLKNLTRLSLCNTGLVNLPNFAFRSTNLRILDVSKNYGIFSRPLVLFGLENTLEIIYARDIGLRTTDIFYNFTELEVADLSLNEIQVVNPQMTRTLRSLQVLILDRNRISSWYTRTFLHIPNLEFLALRDNIITIITEEMIRDFANIRYIGMSGNLIICNCFAKDFIEIAYRNELNYSRNDITGTGLARGYPNASVEVYHRGFIDVNSLIEDRHVVTINCTNDCSETDDNFDGNFVVFDFVLLNYVCLLLPESQSRPFFDVPGCGKVSRDIHYDKAISNSRNLLYILLALPILLILLAFVYAFRRNFRYFCITMRNSAMLSLINNNEVIDDDTIFHYDVFVSYCNDDRNWVLDHLLPRLETDCSVSACLHERDFQVGHSILENIVSCMDRSKSIMLIISQKFLLSQWCQFEMHLAQHRLLETRREDLTLVLLEEIPRRLRPNTLHYLMLTKTYIVWPKDNSERELFWKRLKKTLVTIKLKHSKSDNVSLA